MTQKQKWTFKIAKSVDQWRLMVFITVVPVGFAFWLWITIAHGLIIVLVIWQSNLSCYFWCMWVYCVIQWWFSVFILQPKKKWCMWVCSYNSFPKAKFVFNSINYSCHQRREYNIFLITKRVSKKKSKWKKNLEH